MARKALLVGINDYKGIWDLRGCINDVKNAREVLKTYLGFQNDDIRVLVDSRATKENIMTRLASMIDTAKPGDFLVFHFSGHGSQIRDRNNDELEDHLDELLCPYDIDWDDCFILDDHLGELFRRLPEDVLFEVILDCCHSGTATRSIRPPCEEAEEQAPRLVRFLKPPEDILCRSEGEEHTLEPTRGFTTPNRITLNHILWAGCHSNQESADALINGNYCGAFSYYFYKHFRETEGRLTRKTLLERVTESLKYRNYFQIPQLECRDEVTANHYPFQYSRLRSVERDLSLITPYMQGDDVRRVQEALVKAGFSVSTDGIFGPKTLEIVIQFQKKYYLEPDGVIGGKTREKLFG